MADGCGVEVAVVNTYFKKREEHMVTYKCAGRSTQTIAYAEGSVCK